jgi:hypothetical protein
MRRISPDSGRRCNQFRSDAVVCAVLIFTVKSAMVSMMLRLFLHRLPVRVHTLSAVIALALFAASPARLSAQSADVVRGRVVDDSARAVVGAAVNITRGPDRLVQSTVTDSAGRYSVRFDPGTGDYLVHVAYAGFRPARRRVERVGTERELVADFTLGRDSPCWPPCA